MARPIGKEDADAEPPPQLPPILDDGGQSFNPRQHPATVTLADERAPSGHQSQSLGLAEKHLAATPGAGPRGEGAPVLPPRVVPRGCAGAPAVRAARVESYDFNDSDMASAFGTIDTWLATAARGKANIDPAQIPWDALRTLVKQSVYGGRVDSDFDQRILDSFVDSLFTARAYNVDFDLVPAVAGATAQMLTAPEGTKIEHFLTWVHALPEREPPSWLSLPPTAERVIAIAQGMSDRTRLLA